MKKKNVTLKNFRTGKTINAESISKFCKLAKLTGNDKFHITPVLNEQRLHHKGWCIPDFINPKGYNISDIYGNKYNVKNILLLGEKNNISKGKLKKLIDGKIPFYKGLFLTGNTPEFKPNIKWRYTINIFGKKYVTENLSELSRKLGTKHPGYLYKFVNGQFPNAYGWELLKVESFIPNKRILK